MANSAIIEQWHNGSPTVRGALSSFSLPPPARPGRDAKSLPQQDLTENQTFSEDPSSASLRMTKSQRLRVANEEQWRLQKQQHAKLGGKEHCASPSEGPRNTIRAKHKKKLSQKQRKAIAASEGEAGSTAVCEHRRQEESNISWTASMLTAASSTKADIPVSEPDILYAEALSGADAGNHTGRGKALVHHVRHAEEEQRVQTGKMERERRNCDRERRVRGSAGLQQAPGSSNYHLHRSEFDQTAKETNITSDLCNLSLWDAPVISSSIMAPSVTCSPSSVARCFHIMELLDIVAEYVYDNGSSRAAFAASLSFMLVCKRFMLVMFRKLASIRFFDTFYIVGRERFDDNYAYCLRHLRFRDSYLAKFDDETNSTKYVDQNMIIYSRYGLIRFRQASFPKLKTLEICEPGSLGMVLAAPLAPSLQEIITRSPVLLSDGCIMQISEFYSRLRRIEIANPGIPLQPHEMDFSTGFTDKAFLHLLSRVRFTLEELVLYCPKAADAKQRVLDRRIMAPRLYSLSLAALSSMPRLKVLETFAISEKRYVRDHNNFHGGRPVFNEFFNMAHTLGLPESVAREDHSGAVYAHRFHSRPSDEWRLRASISTIASTAGLLSTPGAIFASRRTSTSSTSTLSSPVSSSVSTFGSDQNDSSPLVSEIQSHHNPVDPAKVTTVKGFLSFEGVVHKRRFFSSLESLKLVSHTAEFVLAFLCMFPGGRKGLEHDDIWNEEDEEKAGTTLRHLEITFIIGSELERFLMRACSLSWNDGDDMQWERMHVLRGLEWLKLNVIGACALRSQDSPQVFVARETIDMFEMEFPHLNLLLTSRVNIIDEFSDSKD
ncbi:hypothetical protein POJ06DRAFT_52201 [Lipomyces tetrasporus]|uniref:Uncharacterized protein n=1 Tax=Lipomyces tetrasporus TaxID=54092 RepID=A0AAD7QWJ9_9ASCO|nr:uncharacterized protein POJ06DRAFT_52201 [Lipomyces tetrasporus]KAJ8102600.1 hypothetical protein POJ06DRAFT_52201 [Lipomyces tetrasporus]